MHMSSEGENQNLIICPEDIVKDEWIDYNGHLNMAFYNVLFDKGVDFFTTESELGRSTPEAGWVRYSPLRFIFNTYRN